MHPISELIIKHFKNEISPEEQLELHRWLDGSVENYNLFYSLCDDYANRENIICYAEDKEAVSRKLRERIPELATTHRKDLQRRAVFLAASILVVAVVGVYFFTNRSTPRVDTSLARRMSPGTDEKKAVLQLSDHSTIALDSILPGSSIEDGHTIIFKEKNGLLKYIASKRPSSANPGINTITTAVAGKYQVILPDSTRVWLNAASSLEFPVTFDANERHVKLKGQGYFEVAKDPTRPFLVTAARVQVEVLGTHFDINAYGDEDAVKTTLLEGSLRVNPQSDIAEQHPPKPVLLKPGEQLSLAHDGNLSLSKPDLKDITGWLDDVIHFEMKDIRTIMRQVARYYKVQVIFEKPVSKQKFTATLDTRLPLSRFLEVLQLTSYVSFRQEGNKVIVISN